MTLARGLALFAFVGALLFAGCVAPATDLPLGHDGMDHAQMTPQWTLSLKGCEEGGFIASAYMAPAPWQKRDIRPEIGPSYLAAVPTAGNWHNGFHCTSGVYDGVPLKDFDFGFIGDAILAPAFDTGGADQHFVVSGFGLQESKARDDLLAIINADISHARSAHVTWYNDNFVETIYNDTDKGTYGGIGPISYYRDVPDRVTRYWWTVAANGETIHHDHHGSNPQAAADPEGGFNPFYIDVYTSAGPEWSSPGDRVSFTTHTGTTDHGSGPVPSNPGELNRNVVYQHPDVTITFGAVLKDVHIESEWVH